LRVDKEVRRLIGDLQSSLTGVVSDGEAVVVTVTAPIRLGSKTTAELELRIKEALARKPPRRDIADTIHGNHVQVRFVQGVPTHVSRIIGFVHNPDPHSDILLELAQSLLQGIGAAEKSSPKTVTSERWLVLVIEDGFARIDTWRQVHDQLGLSTGFKKILLVFDGNRVEQLTG
jgi:hypothetical protein